MATKKYAFKMATSEATYFVDATTGEFLDDLSGYEILSFGTETKELPDLDDIQEDTSPTGGSGFGGEPDATSSEESGSGNVMSRRTPPNDTLRPVGPRKDLADPTSRAGKIANKGAGFVGGKIVGGLGAAIGMGVAGPLGAMAGGLLGNLAGGKLGAGIINDMRANPQTMALPGKTTKSAPATPADLPKAPRSNPLMAPVSPVTRGPIDPVKAEVTPEAPTDISTYSPVKEMTFEDVENPGFRTPDFNPPSRPVTATPLANTPAAPVERVDRSPIASIDKLTAAPVERVDRSPIASVEPPSFSVVPTAAPRQRSNPLLSASIKVTTPETPVNPMTRTQSRQVVPSLDYERFSRTEAPQVNWGGYNPDEIDPYTRDRVEQAQAKLDFSLNITSGFRDPKRNRAAGGAKNSQHVHGKAVDISMKGLTDSQRTDVVAALGSVSEPGKGRVGAYSGNTAIHYDTAEHSTKGYGGLHPMYDRSIKNIQNAPDWFSKGIGLVSKKDYSTLEKRTVRDPFSAKAIGILDTPQQSNTSVGGFSTPGSYTSSGLYNRQDDEKAMMGFTIAGELSGKTLKGLRENDPVARAELANVVATMENRAHSRRYDGDIKSVMSPSQYNSLSKSALNTTRNNWGDFGEDITRGIDDYYSGKNKPTTPEATHYANYDVVTPSWDHAAVNKTKVGDHTFSTVNLNGTQTPEYQPGKSFQSRVETATRDVINRGSRKSFDESLNQLGAFTTAPNVEMSSKPQDVDRITTFSSTMTAGYPSAVAQQQKAIEKAAEEQAEKETRESGLLGDIARDKVSSSSLDRMSSLSGKSSGGSSLGSSSLSSRSSSTDEDDKKKFGVMSGGSSRGGGIGPGGSGPADPSAGT